MAFKVLHADGATPVDADNPLECSYSAPGTVIFVCDGQYEQTADEVLLTAVGEVVLPAGLEGSVDDGATYSTAPNIGVVGTTNVPGLIRPVLALRYERALLLGDGRYACVPQTTVRADPGSLETAPDTSAPTLGSQLTFTGGEAQLVFAWDAATDDRGVDHYEYEYDDNDTFTSPTQATTASLGATVSVGVADTYYGRYRAVDAAGNPSSWSTTQSAVVTVTDETAPAWPGGSASLVVTASQQSLVLDWVDATDAVGVDHYEVWRSTTAGGTFELIATPAASTYTDAIGLVDTQRFYKVKAVDAANNASTFSAEANGTTSKNVWLSGGTRIMGESPTTNSNNGYLAAGWLGGDQATSEYRTLILVPLAAIPATVPTTLLKMKLDPSGVEGTGGDTIRIFRSRIPIVSNEATWMRASTATSWTTSGAKDSSNDYYSSPYADNQNAAANGQWQTWDVTALLQAAKDASLTVCPLIVTTTKAWAAGQQNRNIYVSYTGGGVSANRPYVQVG